MINKKASLRAKRSNLVTEGDCRVAALLAMTIEVLA